MKEMWIDTLNTSSIQEERKAIFIQAIYQAFNLRELRGVSVKYILGLASWTKNVTIYKLYNYFSTRICLPTEEQPWIENQRIPVVPDLVPYFAQDLENYVPEETGETEEIDIMWYIDRTPTLLQETEFMTYSSLEMMPLRRRITPYHLTFDDNEEMLIRNLNAEFNSVAKKYNIIPELLVQEEDILEKIDDCPICYESTKLIDNVELGCGHQFCGTCIIRIFKEHKELTVPCCALCRGKMQKCSVKKEEVYNQIVEYCNV
jgi:hypothetical protein